MGEEFSVLEKARVGVVTDVIQELPYTYKDDRITETMVITDQTFMKGSKEDMTGEIAVSTFDGGFTISGSPFRNEVQISISFVDAINAIWNTANNETDQYIEDRIEKHRVNPMVNISRFAPNLENGEGVRFEKGETVRYRMRSGEEHDIVIDSELMQNSGYLGYEAIFDDGVRAFAVEKGIIDWEGKAP